MITIAYDVNDAKWVAAIWFEGTRETYYGHTPQVALEELQLDAAVRFMRSADCPDINEVGKFQEDHLSNHF